MAERTTVGKEKITALFDAGTFVETGAYIKRADGASVGAVCGYGAVCGKLVYAFVQDSDRNKGAFDMLQAEKIVRLYELAQKNGAPVIGVFDSIGAYVCDGAEAMAAYGKLLKAVSDASGVIPQYAVVSGVCSGLAATVASLFDVVTVVKGKGKLFVNAPFLVGKEVGEAEYAAKTGLSTVLCEDEASAFSLMARLVEMLPSNNAEGVTIEENGDDVNRRVSVQGQSTTEILKQIVDCGSWLELAADYAPEMVTGFASFGGVACGVIANNGTVDGGALTGEGARKAAKLVRFCDSFSIPLVSLIDSVGVKVSAEEEGAPLAAQLGKLAMAYASADTAKITVVTGKAYGASFTLMGCKALGADLVYALPQTQISVMAPASAVAFLWNGKIDEKNSREALEAEWVRQYATPAAAAADGSIDDVPDEGELRQRICSAVYMLMTKNGAATVRKHCNLPL